MAATPEILSKLNIGSGMNNSEIIAALVNAEKAPALDRIERNGYDVLAARISLTLPEKLFLLARTWFKVKCRVWR